MCELTHSCCTPYRLVQDDPELLADDSVVEKVVSGLLRLENYHVAGELCQSQGNQSKAMEFYCKGNIYTKAVELARYVSPASMYMRFARKSIGQHSHSVVLMWCLLKYERTDVFNHPIK